MSGWSEQNLYKISCEHNDKDGWFYEGSWMADTWQDAIQNWRDEKRKTRGVTFQMLSEAPSEDGRSGIMEVTPDDILPAWDYLVSAQQVKATIVEDD